MLLNNEKDEDKKKELQRKVDDLDKLTESASRLIFRTQEKGLDPTTNTY